MGSRLDDNRDTTGRFMQAAARHRRRRGWTQSRLAEELGVSPVSVSSWEAGNRSLTLEQARRIAELLDTTVDELLADGDRQPSIAGVERHVHQLQVTVADLVDEVATLAGDLRELANRQSDRTGK